MMKSIYSKFVIATMAIILTSTILGFFISNLYYQQLVKPMNDEKNVKVAKNLAGYIGSNQSKSIDLEAYLQNASSMGYQIYAVNSAGYKQYFGADFKLHNLEEKAVDRVLQGEIYHGMKEFPMETFVTGFFANELKNTVGVPFTYENEPYALFLRPDIKLLFSEIHVLMGWMILIMFVVSVLLVLVAAKFLIKPIVKLTSATKEIQQGQFDIKLDISRQDEIGVLARSFEEMSHRLSQLDQMRTEFVSNVSHDFQSPLLNIQGYTELLENDNLTSTEKARYIRIIRQETRRLSLMTKQLLLLTSLEKEDYYFKPDSYNVGNQLKELVQTYLWQLDEKDITITYTIPDVMFNGDASLLFNAWENLLTNAIKYNEENGEIELILIEESDYIRVIFKDSGIGMTAEEQLRIFDRFYRADPSRTREIEGTGLGLSIVDRIVRLHEGSISVNSEPDKGTEFMITLPKL